MRSLVRERYSRTPIAKQRRPNYFDTPKVIVKLIVGVFDGAIQENPPEWSSYCHP
jgi:hypothetical protein